MKQQDKDNELKLAELKTPVGEPDLVTQAINTVNKANETSVLMEVLCERLGLKPNETTHTAFVEAFTKLQAASLEAQKMLQEKFVTAPIPEKRRRKRMTNV